MRGGALVRGTPLVAEPDRGLGLAEQLRYASSTSADRPYFASSS